MKRKLGGRPWWFGAVPVLLAMGTFLTFAQGASAQDNAMDALRKAEPVELDRFAYLKRLSLDLRGDVPSWEEYESLEEVGDVPDAVIDNLLDSRGFLEVMEGFHKDLLWANVGNFQYIIFYADLTRANVGPPEDRHTVLYLRRRSSYYRGAPGDAENDYIPCSHEPATFDENGQIETTCDPDTGRCIEGWVWVEPYWAPGEQVKVCAFDAQDAEYGAGNVHCGSPNARREATCGCGPGMRYCDYSGNGVNVQAEIGRSFSEQVLRVISWVIANNRPYHEILTTRTSFVNGPLIHYYKHQIQLAANIDVTPAPVEGLFLPETAWNDTDWVQVLQGPEHSGILTSYAFLLRFQTNRGRVNRFYNAFLDSAFDGTQSTGTPDCTDESGDLTKRCKCQNCHIAIEPWAAHWARWKQQGGGFLSSSEFPLYDETCETCARNGLGTCPRYCRNEYVVETIPADREPYLGYLRGYEFLKDQHQINAEAGPRLWVERTLQDGSLARGVISKMWKFFMRRDLTKTKADQEIQAELLRVFVASNYNLKALVKAIVTHPAYRRIR